MSFTSSFLVLRAALVHQAQHQQGDGAHAGQDLEADGEVHPEDGAGAVQIADGTLLIEDVLAELRADGHAHHGQRHIHHGGKALGAVEQVRAEGAGGGLIAVAQIQDRDHRHHQHAALEAAAGAQVSVEDDVHHVHQHQGKETVRAAAENDVFHFDLVVHFSSSFPAFLVKRMTALPATAVIRIKASPMVS